MRNRVYLLMLILNVLNLVRVESSNVILPNFNNITSVDGLPSDVINDLDIDSYGYIWIGTNKGVARYDGYTSKCYDDIPSPNPLRRNSIKDIFVDQYGVVWCGSDNGLFTIDSHTDEISQIEADEFDNNPILYIYEYEDDIWISTFRNLYKYHRADGRIVNMSGSFSSNRNRYISSDEDGNLWVLSMNNNIAVYDKENDKYVNFPTNYTPNTEIKEIATSLLFESGRTYVTTWRGNLYEIKYDDGFDNIEYLLLDVKVEGSIVNIEKDDVFNYYWIATLNGLVVTDSLTNPTMVEDISEELYLGSTKLQSLLYTPKEGILWFGSEGCGISKLSLNNPVIKNYTLTDKNTNIKSNYVSTIYERGDRLWFGLNNSPMAILDRSTGSLTSLDENPLIAPYVRGVMGVSCITYIRSRNEIWIGSSYNGIWTIALDDDDNIVKYERLVSGGSVGFSNRINKIFEDSKGRIFVCSKDSKLIMYTHDESGKLNGTRLHSKSKEVTKQFLHNTHILDICEDPLSGDLLFATDNRGAWRCSNIESDERVFKRIKVLCQDVELNQTTALLIGSNSTIWLGTNNYGLAKYSPESDQFDIDEHILAKNIKSINSLEIDRNRDLWLGTNRGVVRYNVDTHNAILFDSRDGLSSNSFVNKSVVYSQKTNNIYYGSYGGYSTIDVGTLKYNKTIPTPQITDISLSGRSILHSSGEMGSNVERDATGAISQVNLYDGETNFTIDFTSLIHQNPVKISFEYMLHGVDTEPRQAINGNHQALYNNLRQGSYTFELKAYNNSGVVSSVPTKLTVKVHPKWYNSTWGWAMWIGILLIIVAYVAYTMIVRIRYRRSMRNARFEIEKNQEINTLKLQFFANVSHEFLTPLTIISTGLEDISVISQQDEKLFNVIKSNTKRLITLTEEILEFRKAETGNLKLQVSKGDLYQLIMDIANDDFRYLIRKKSLSLSIDCPSEDIYGYFDRDKLTKILYNLLSNAYKYNIEGGEIYIRIDVLDYDYDESDESVTLCQKVKISVTNTGSIITDEQKENLFKRFYDGAYRQFDTKGVGIGLSLTKELVELHKGEISVTSNKANGTTFIITLPLSRNSFSANELLPIDLTIANSIDAGSSEENRVDESSNVEEVAHQTILLVEDDADCQFVINTYLSKQYNVLLASDGKEALLIAQTQEIDVIVSDVMMPNMSGYELCRAVKEDIATSHIPVILLTAKRADEAKIEGLSCGAEAYLTKPIEMKILGAQITSMLKSRERFAQRFKQGDLLSETLDSSDEQSSYISYNERFMSEAIAVVKDNLSNYDFDIKDFEAALGVTRSTLYRKLKSQVNMSPLEFVRNVRLQCAREILQTKGNRVSVSEIAYHTGFNTPRYFTSCFKKEFGITPTQFIEEQNIE